jgi:hypothetical protein
MAGVRVAARQCAVATHGRAIACFCNTACIVRIVRIVRISRAFRVFRVSS